jgi:hypothetical protein
MPVPGPWYVIRFKVQAQFKSTTSILHPGRSGVASIPTRNGCNGAQGKAVKPSKEPRKALEKHSSKRIRQENLNNLYAEVCSAILAQLKRGTRPREGKQSSSDHG